jgi:isohexenylglutaconyl-CoA hydratase
MAAAPPELEHLVLTFEGGVARVTLDRPQVRNAMSFAMVDELVAALRWAEEAGARVLVLRGAGGHFCAGGDLKDMASTRGPAPKDGEADPAAVGNARFGHLALVYRRAAMPTVAVLEGAVMGGGFGLACTVDVALAGPTARFGLPETGLGLVPAQIAPFLVDRLGRSEAKRLAVTGARIDAAEALRIGLVHGLAETAEGVDALVDRTIGQILRAAPEANRVTKQLFEEATLTEAYVEGAAKKFAAATRGAEGMEGVMAFIEKRRPSWAPAKEE